MTTAASSITAKDIRHVCWTLAIWAGVIGGGAVVGVAAGFGIIITIARFLM